MELYQYVCNGRCSLKLVLICNSEKNVNDALYIRAGVLSDPSAPSSFGAWISYVASNHVGALSFLLVEFCLFFSVAVLTVIQASQVSPHFFFFFSFLHVFVPLMI